ncbi:MAG: glycosyltransferase family 4 protein [Bacteroidales bacterium]
MKVLFVSSGKAGDVGHVVRNQGESLIRAGVEIDYLTIRRGISGYVRAIPIIRRTFREGGYDLVHAHYSLSAFSSTLAGVRPLVVSLMGSDAVTPLPVRILLRILSSVRWDGTIVKTAEMKSRLRLDKAYVVPNGVDLERFAPVEKTEARRQLNISPEKKVILFVAAKNRPEKNLPLAMEAVKLLNDSAIEFMHLYDKQNTEVAVHLNAADLLLLTSMREGGVNVIKEAMACNCPIVSTDVGDVRKVISGTDGCFICGNDSMSIADNIRQALSFGRRTDGRAGIVEQGLDSASVARRIIDLYSSVQRSG